MATLFELAGQYAALLDLDQSDEAVANTLEGLAAEIETKADVICAVLAELDGHAGAIDAEITRLQQRVGQFAGRARRLREYVKAAMERNAIRKLDTPLHSLRVITNPPKVIIDDAAAVPAEFWRESTQRSIDLRLVKEFGEVPGTHIEQSTRLKIS